MIFDDRNQTIIININGGLRSNLSLESIISIDSDMFIQNSTNTNKASLSKGNTTRENIKELTMEEGKNTKTIWPQISNDSEFSDISITPSLIKSDIISQPQELENPVEELKPRLHYTNFKAGMDKVDKNEIERKIFEISK